MLIDDLGEQFRELKSAYRNGSISSLVSLEGNNYQGKAFSGA